MTLPNWLLDEMNVRSSQIHRRNRHSGRIGRLISHFNKELNLTTPDRRSLSESPRRLYRSNSANGALTTTHHPPWNNSELQNQRVQSFFKGLQGDLENRKASPVKIAATPSNHVPEIKPLHHPINPDRALYNYMKIQGLFDQRGPETTKKPLQRSKSVSFADTVTQPTACQRLGVACSHTITPVTNSTLEGRSRLSNHQFHRFNGKPDIINPPPSQTIKLYHREKINPTNHVKRIVNQYQPNQYGYPQKLEVALFICIIIVFFSNFKLNYCLYGQLFLF